MEKNLEVLLERFEIDFLVIINTYLECVRDFPNNKKEFNEKAMEEFIKLAKEISKELKK